MKASAKKKKKKVDYCMLYFHDSNTSLLFLAVGVAKCLYVSMREVYRVLPSGPTDLGTVP